MENLAKSIRNRYVLFISSIIIIITSGLIIVQNSVSAQKDAALLINKASNQCMLSESITSLVFSMDDMASDTINLDSINSLKILVDEFETSHNYLYAINKQKGDNSTLDSLLDISETYLKTIVSSSKNIIENPFKKLIKQDIRIIAETESPYFLTMQTAVLEYQKAAEKNIDKLKSTVYFLAVLASLILIGQLVFILIPALNQLFRDNKVLLQSNNELAISEGKLMSSMTELTKLKTDLEKKEAYNKIFIEQAPTAIAMLDNNMVYMAVSQRWITDYKMEGRQIIGVSHYDLFPEIGDDWKENHQKCLNGAIDTCDEAPFTRADGSIQWIYWDVRPWYISEDIIGGLLMHTGDITKTKEKDLERIRIEKILERTNEVARIGTWEVDIIKNKIIWSKVVCEIHEVPESYKPDLETAINFFNEGESRDKIEKVVNEAIQYGTSYDVEVELVTAKGNIIWTRAIGQAEFVDGVCVRLFGVFQDINKEKSSQIALNEAHVQLKAIFNSGSISIITTGIDGIIDRFNRGAEILTGYSASEMIGLQKPRMFLLEDEFEKFKNDIARQYNKDPLGLHPQLELSKHNSYDTREWTYVRKDGSTLPALLTLTGIKDEEGELIGFLGISTDISEKRRAQDELVRKNQLLSYAEEITLMGNWQWDTVADIVVWSDNLYNIFKLDKEVKNLNFDTYFNFVHPDDKDIVAHYFNKTVDEKSLKRFTHRIIAGDGQLKYIQLLGQVIVNDKGEVIEMIGTCQDITAIKASERELYTAHMQLKAIFNSGPIAIVSTNNDGIINHFNHGAEVLLGYTASEMIGLKVPEIFHIEDELEKFRVDIAKTYGADLHGFDPYLELAKHNEYDTREWTYRRKDGSTFPVELTLTAIKDEGGKKIGFLGVSFDITERKKTENELLRKNQLLNFAEEISMIGHWKWDTIADKVQWSNNLYKMFELGEENTDLTYNSYFNFVHPEDKQIVTNYFSKSANDKKFYRFTHRIITTTGIIKTVQLLGEVITNEKGDVIEMIGTGQDITEQRMAENKFRGLLESAPDAMVIVNEKGKIQLINKQAEKLFGFSIEELHGRSVEMLIPKRLSGNHKSYRDGFFANPKVRAMGVGKEKELFGINKSGKEIPIQISLSPLQTEEGLLVSAAIRDITVQKIAENELLRKNQLLSFAEKITMMGNWQWDLITNIVKWSANLYTIFGLEEDAALTYDTYFSFVHPEDKEKVTEHVEKSINDKKFIDLVHRIQLTDGSVKTIQLLAEVITDSSGAVVEMIGTCQDVTAQKMAENKFRGLLESAPDAMVIVNERGKIQLINKQAEKLFGYSLKELFDKTVEILIPKRYTEHNEHTAHRDGFFSNPKTRRMGEGKELYGMNKKGEEIPIQISLSPLQTEEGLLVSAAIRDITVQKLAENKIIQAKENLEVLTQHLSGQNKQLADFAHITSHNLRSPVSNLNALLHLYDISENEEERKILFEKFEIVTSHLTSTLNTLIEALKTRKESVKELEELDFGEILKKTKEIISGQIIETNSIITSDFSKIPKIKYHKTYLESIFLNLVTNAIKYRSPDRNPEIHIVTEIINEKIKLSIHDNGLGIDLDRHGHKLFGLNKTFHRHPEAKGVGLYLTKIQVETMGGTIYATSEVNKGSVFTITF